MPQKNKAALNIQNTKPMKPTPINIFIATGEASDGKTTTGSRTLQATDFLNDPKSVALCTDEKLSLGKLDERVLRYPLRSRDDFGNIEKLFASKSRFWIDTPGTSKVFMCDALRDPAMFARFGVRFVPVLLVGARGSSLDEARIWLKQMASLPKIFVIHNPKRAITEAEKTTFCELIEDLPGPKERVILHLPPLSESIAKELERLGSPLDDIISGRIDPQTSEIMTRFHVMIDVQDWSVAMDDALKPLYDEVRAALPATTAEDADLTQLERNRESSAIR